MQLLAVILNIRSDYDMSVQNLRIAVARDIEQCYKIPFNKTLSWMQSVNCFSNWTEYEVHFRPVNIEEILDCICE